MDERKKEEEQRRQEKRRSVSRHSPREEAPGPPPAPLLARSSSPPIPTMRGRGGEEASDQAGEVGGTRPASPGVASTLASMRQQIERRRQSLQYEEERLGGEWSGLAEL